MIGNQENELVSERALRRSARKRRRGLRRSVAARVLDRPPRGVGVACPVCRAAAGEACLSRTRRARWSCHRARAVLESATRPSCEGCGACCLVRPYGHGREIVDLWPDEEVPAFVLRDPSSARFGRALPIVGEKEEARCAFLVGPFPGARCGIYERRPIVCRSFVPGGYLCRVIRARAKLGPHPGGWARG